MLSLWEKTSEKKNFEKLNEDIKTDVLIIGGGMAGVLTAYFLQQSGVDYALVEANEIGCGITKNTTAKISVQHGLIYQKLIKELSTEKAKMYYDANERALNKYRNLCRGIDCDFEEKDSFVYTLNDPDIIEKEAKAIEKIGKNADVVKNLPLPFSVSGAVKIENQAQFNPLKFIYSISDGLRIFEHTKVRELVGTTAVTDSGKIKAKKIIVATHFPFINKHGLYFIKMYQHRSYVIALDNAQNVNGIYIDGSDKGLSFRNYKNYLLIGGGGHRTGKKGGNWEELRRFAKKHYTASTEVYNWATQDCITLDKVPYIGKYSSDSDNLYVATGFNKWGMTASMAAAEILCDMVQGRENPYSEVFSPSRTILRPQLAANAFEATVSMLTPTVKRCPHLGCALKWNPYERTWDCPCHGSRFSESGNLIDNPATADMKKKRR